MSPLRLLVTFIFIFTFTVTAIVTVTVTVVRAGCVPADRRDSRT
ncbi:hypothetical protein [Streptomyces laurentii]